MFFDIDNKIYIQIDNTWFDLTSYTDHPGGAQIFKRYHLRNATDAFNQIRGHDDSLVFSKLEELEIKNILLKIYLNLIRKENTNIKNDIASIV
jgi:cytochrome b involved in lipid metabolism